jgi:copper chaperone CopZ
METVTLKIPNMKSYHCQTTVTNTVKNMGAMMRSIAPTKAEIELTNGLTREAVIQAIEKAGYLLENKEKL